MTSTTDTVLLIIVTTLLSILLLATIILVIVFVKLLNSVRQVVAKAEKVIDSVESAAEVFRDTQGRMAFLKLVRNIIKMAQRRHKDG